MDFLEEIFKELLEMLRLHGWQQSWLIINYFHFSHSARSDQNHVRDELRSIHTTLDKWKAFGPILEVHLAVVL